MKLKLDQYNDLKEEDYEAIKKAMFSLKPE
jgi:hypothetical protein